MKLVFAKNIGFCSGVKRAVAIAEKSLKVDPNPIQFLGPLIHNEKVIRRLKKQGGKFISNVKEVKPGTLILRAHGTPSDFQKTKIKNLVIRDATCPLVKKAQLATQGLFENGYQVIIIGDRNHPETKGIKGYINNQAIIVENGKQAETLPKFEKIGVVAQTTQNLNQVDRVLKILRNKTKELKWANTICPEVLIRQKELNQILRKAEGILVIGSRSSANTRRLVKIAKNFKRQVFLVNSLEELRKKGIKDVSSLGVVSGTSAPDDEIKKIKKWLEKKLK